MAASTRKPQAKGATKAKPKPKTKAKGKAPTKAKGKAPAKAKPTTRPKAKGKAKPKGKSAPARTPPGKTPASRSGSRYAITHDIERPHMRLGFIWFVALVFALVLGPVALAVLFALVSAVGAMQVATAWRRRRQRSNVAVAGLCGAALPLAAGWGGRALGLAVLGCVVASLAVAALLPAGKRHPPLIATAGLSVRSWLFVGGASASVVLCAHYDLGAAVALVVLMSAYDAGDYVVGSGAGSAWEGPLGGIATVGVLTFSLFVMNLSPFQDGGVVVYGAVLAVLAPLGQLAASAVLPAADDLASGLRRVDSVLLAGPVWAVLLQLGVGQ